MAKALRYSRQRERIYEYLAGTGEHPSAEMIYAELKAEMPELSLGTVYRNLKLLEELGKIQRVITSRGHERYDAVCRDHAHFICRECGSIADVFSVDWPALRRCAALEDGCRAQRLDLMISGLCPRCSQQQENTQDLE